MATAPDWDAIRAEHRGTHKELREYEVVGPHGVFDHEPGSIVSLALTEGEENALIESGHLVLVDDQAAPEEAPVVEEVAVAVESATVEAHQEDDLSQ